MKILQLGKFYPIEGGVEKVAYDLMEGVSEQGVACDMLCAAVKGPGTVIKVNENARVISCRTWVKAAATMISPSMITALRSMRKDYDIIHVHHPDPMAALALWLSGYKGRVILHWHSDIQKQKFLLRLYRPLQQWLIGRADVVIGTTPVYIKESPFLKDAQNKTACLPIGVVPMHPDAEAVKAIRQRYPGKKIVLSLGRLVAYKGYQFLVEAAAYLSDDYVILIGGSGALKGPLQEQIDNMHLNHKVTLLGRISDEDLPAYFGACHVFCLSSNQKTEAFGIVQIEAMSCGKPVVATRIPHSGVAWVNEDGVSGLNVQPSNARELAAAITKLTEDETIYNRFSSGASTRYQEMFTKEEMISKCLKIYGTPAKFRVWLAKDGLKPVHEEG